MRIDRNEFKLDPHKTGYGNKFMVLLNSEEFPKSPMSDSQNNINENNLKNFGHSSKFRLN